MMAPRVPHSVRRVLADFPGITLVRAQQIARDRETLRRRRQPSTAIKWFVS